MSMERGGAAELRTPRHDSDGDFPADTPDCELIKETVLRYGLASMQLMFMECRQLDVWTADSDDPKDIAERKVAAISW